MTEIVWYPVPPALIVAGLTTMLHGTLFPALFAGICVYLAVGIAILLSKVK